MARTTAEVLGARIEHLNRKVARLQRAIRKLEQENALLKWEMEAKHGDDEKRLCISS